MRLIPTLLATSMMLCAAPASAIPNMWTNNFAMGVTEYIITSPEKTVLNVSCTTNPDEQDNLQHSVYITLPGGKGANSHEEDKTITLVTGDSQYPVPSSLGWLGGDNAWLSFIEALSQASKFDIYINDDKVGSFSPSAENIRKELDGINECKDIRYQEAQ